MIVGEFPEASFGDTYHELLEMILHRGFEDVNRRTGEPIRMVAGGASFKLDVSDGRIPVAGVRRLYPRTAAAETAWYLMAERDVTWLRRYAPIWDKFVEDDGVTVDSAYGYRWRKHFGRDQLKLAVDALRADDSDRRVYVDAWDASKDGLGAKGQKNVPCPIGFTFSVVDGVLHSSIFIRSSDVFVGLPYDVMGHAMLMDAVGVSIGVELGTMHVTLAHPHVYGKHFDMAEQALLQELQLVGPDQVGWSIEEIEAEPASYVEAVAAESKLVTWPAFAPRPEVIQ